ncbi:MAG: hypothetical protein H8D80_00185 [Proteobacteria bacterium]|nr:hypothetical protein [Pseudomonadota bacterium]
MLNFKQYLLEQSTVDPSDIAVIDAFLSHTPGVEGVYIKTVANDEGDFTPEDIRIDLISGREKTGLAQYDNGGVISLATLGKMIDNTPGTMAIQNMLRDKAKAKGLRIL